MKILKMINSCAIEKMKSPIDIKFPWIYKNFEVTIKPLSIINLEFKKKTENEFYIEETFGIITYLNKEYIGTEIHFIYPSEHLLNNIRYSMELQLLAKDESNNQITLIYLFEQNNVFSNQFLYQLGFGTGELKKLLAEHEKSFFEIKNVFSISNYGTNSTDFLLYEGTSSINCKDSLIFINKNIDWVGKEQLREFNIYKRSKYEIKSVKDKQIYQNFISPENINYSNIQKKKITDTIIPSEIDKEYYMFEKYDEDEPLGYFPDINEDDSRIPIWDPKIFTLKKLILENNFKRSGPFKFVPLAFDKISLNGEVSTYTPVYILVPNDFMLNFNETPKFIPMLLRSNYTISDGIRPNLLIDVPIYYNKTKIPEIKKKEKEEEKKNFEEEFSKICMQYMLTVVVNRNLDQESIFENVDKMVQNETQINKCKEFVIVPKSYDEDLSIDGNIQNWKVGDTICTLKLETTLNKPIDFTEEDGIVADYISRDCRNNSILDVFAKFDNTNIESLSKNQILAYKKGIDNIVNFD